MVTLVHLDILSKVNRVSDISDQLIPEFTNILNWLKENRLSLNSIKTEFMLIGSVQKIQPLNNLIAIRANITWDDHIDYISVKIRRNIGIL